MMRRLLVALALMTLVAVVDGRERIEIRVRPAFSIAPAEVQLEFRITPDSENRGLVVSAESDAFYRSSLIELEGEHAQRVVSIRYQSLPAGDYSVRGALIDAEGHERAAAEKQITVMTSGGEH